ncbi:MAG: aspartate aminotransferase family protein [Bryobacteraceae bacterium]|nr:aspartate aminotransferase family protein [Bryobacteraceae bacterium]
MMDEEGDLNLSPRRRDFQRRHINEETAALLAEDEKYFLRQALSTPCLNVLRHARGSEIEDWQGRRLLDFHGNNVHHAGFGHPLIIEAIERQLRDLPFCTRRYTNRPAIDLAKRLAHLAPGSLNKVLFAPGGALAIGMALKLARAATGRHKTLSLWESFHGASLDAISIGGEAIFRQNMGPLLPGARHIPPPDPRDCPFACGAQCSLQCAHYAEYVMDKEGDIGAVIVETVRASSRLAPPGYLEILRAACDKHNALLIFDEIPHALGRTGRMFTCENYGVTPDLLVIGKALGGGVFPLAALLAREDLDGPMAAQALGHYTHEKNPVACAAGLALLDVIERENLCENARIMGDYFLEKMRPLQQRHPLIGAVRALGLLMGIDLVHPDGSKATGQADQVMYLCLERGLSFKTTMGNTLTLTPPLNITRDEMDRALAILDEALSVTESA